jgi:hypothetical protein
VIGVPRHNPDVAGFRANRTRLGFFQNPIMIPMKNAASGAAYVTAAKIVRIAARVPGQKLRFI